MCKEGWYVGFGEEEEVTPLKWGGTEKKGRETKILKRGSNWVKGWEL